MMDNTEFPLDRWQQLAEVTLPNALASERLISETVALAGRRLHLHEPLLTRLYTALREAVRNRLNAVQRDQENARIGLRVQVSTQVTVRQKGDSASWSFFLLERMLTASSGVGQPIIEIYLYQEPAL
jgi:hypothetical protein